MAGHRYASGAALLISLLLLTALTLLGLAAASDSKLQHRMTGNLEAARLAERNANAALTWAEHWLLGLDGANGPAACKDACKDDQPIREVGAYPAAPEYAGADWWDSNGYSSGHDPVSGALLDGAFASGSGRFIIEQLRFEEGGVPADEGPDLGYYRIIARASGPGPLSVAVTESIIARPWGDAAWADPFPAEPGHPGFCHGPEIDGPCGRLAWQQRR